MSHQCIPAQFIQSCKSKQMSHLFVFPVYKNFLPGVYMWLYSDFSFIYNILLLSVSLSSVFSWCNLVVLFLVYTCILLTHLSSVFLSPIVHLCLPCDFPSCEILHSVSLSSVLIATNKHL